MDQKCDRCLSTRCVCNTPRDPWFPTDSVLAVRMLRDAFAEFEALSASHPEDERLRRSAAECRTFLGGLVSSDMLRVFVEEEYGYRYWTWNFPGTVDELIAEWKAGRIPSVGYIYRGEFKGTCEQVETPSFDPFPGVSDEEYLAHPEKYDVEDEALLKELGGMWDVFLSKYDATCHIHEESDSVLSINEKRFSWTAEVDHDFVLQDLTKMLRAENE